MQTIKDCAVIKIADEDPLIKAINNWLKVYEAQVIQREIVNADSWLLENNRTKKNYLRFIGNWLRRCKIYKYTGGDNDKLSTTDRGEKFDGVYKYEIIE